MDKKTRKSTGIDCACVIHNNLYSFDYVEKLYRGLKKHLNDEVRLHVYTEKTRDVPDYMIKHCLLDWPGISGPKQSWWYKIQLFNPEFHSGSLLYLDLDTVIVNDLTWITELSTKYFWSIHDFQRLYKQDHNKINSSVMWFNTNKWSNVYNDFNWKNFSTIKTKYRGDQDYIFDKIPEEKRRFLDSDRIKSWRWEVHDGGWDFKNRAAKSPGTGTVYDESVSLLIFHGKPKPHEITDGAVKRHWV